MVKPKSCSSDPTQLGQGFHDDNDDAEFQINFFLCWHLFRGHASGANRFLLDNVVAPSVLEIVISSRKQYNQLAVFTLKFSSRKS